MNTTPSSDSIAAATELLRKAGYRVDRVSTDEERARAWLQLHGRDIGVALDIFEPEKLDLSLDTLANGLSLETRFAAQTRGIVYQVAIHSVRGSLLTQEPLTALRFLFHDSSEGLGFRDLPSPLKRLPEMAFYREREEALMDCVSARYSLGVSFWKRPEIKAIDERMLHIEQAELLSRPPRGREWGYWAHRIGKPGGRPAIEALSPAQAKRVWLLRVAEVAEEAGYDELREEALAVIEMDCRAESYPLVAAP